MSLMKCDVCGCVDSKVVDSRLTEDGTAVRRRRACVQCGQRITTYERSTGRHDDDVTAMLKDHPYIRESFVRDPRKAECYALHLTHEQWLIAAAIAVIWNPKLGQCGSTMLFQISWRPCAVSAKGGWWEAWCCPAVGVARIGGKDTRPFWGGLKYHANITEGPAFYFEHLSLDAAVPVYTSRINNYQGVGVSEAFRYWAEFRQKLDVRDSLNPKLYFPKAHWSPTHGRTMR